MKKYISLLLCILLLASCSNSGEKRSRVLKVYNWADYIDEEVLTEFPAWYKEQDRRRHSYYLPSIRYQRNHAH